MGESLIIKKEIADNEELFATIGVTYPSGSTCTCTNGNRTLTDTDTNGKVVFTIPYAGTWTVTATNGNQTKSIQTTISTKGEAKTVTIKYQLVLFDNGSYASETGGWTGISNNSLTSSITCYNMDGVYQWTCQTAKPVNLTDYTTLYFTASTVSQSYYYTCYFGVGTSQYSHTAKAWIESPTTYSINISSLNSSYYLSLYHGGAASQNGGWDGNTMVSISKVWLV